MFSVDPNGPAAPPPRRPPVWVGAAVATGVVLLVLIGVWVHSAGSDPSGADRAVGPYTSATTTTIEGRSLPTAPPATTGRPAGDGSGAVFTTCRDIAQKFPFGPRTCTIVSPSGLSGTERLPVVVLLHGANTTPADVIATGGWAAAVSRDRFIVAAPQGLFSSWNAGDCCLLAHSAQVDDAGFVDQVIGQLVARPDVDPARVYLVGESNGGMMVYRSLCTTEHPIAGAASVEGTSVSNCPPRAPVPLLHVHGRDDVTIPYRGGPSAVPLVVGANFVPVEQSLAQFASGEGCAEPPAQSTTGSATVRVWSGCRGGVEVRLASVAGVGHSWPRSPAYDTTAEILRFFGLAHA
jgi:polyhydroxybutyrate depolymerase